MSSLKTAHEDKEDIEDMTTNRGHGGLCAKIKSPFLCHYDYKANPVDMQVDIGTYATRISDRNLISGKQKIKLTGYAGTYVAASMLDATRPTWPWLQVSSQRRSLGKYNSYTIKFLASNSI